MKPKDAIRLDVRPLLSHGQEPFPAIMQAKNSLEPGQSLILIAPFEPVPLYAFFEKSGFAIESSTGSDGTWEITFAPDESRTAPDHAREMDLRQLEPPEPLQRALEALSEVGRGETLTIHTRFRPVHLLEQLDNLGFDSETEAIGPQHWTTHLWRVPPA